MRKQHLKKTKKATPTLWVAFLLLAFMASPSYSSESQMTWKKKLKTHSLGVGIGQVFLYGDYGKTGDDSMGLDLFYAYTASYSFDLLVNTHYSSHSNGPLNTSLWGTTVNIKGRLMDFDSFSPYFLGGLGFYLPKLKRNINGAIKESHQKLGFGFSLGTGLDLRLNKKVSVGLMLAYHHPFDVGQGLDPDVSGSYLRVLLNTLYTF